MGAGGGVGTAGQPWLLGSFPNPGCFVATRHCYAAARFCHCDAAPVSCSPARVLDAGPPRRKAGTPAAEIKIAPQAVTPQFLQRAVQINGTVAGAVVAALREGGFLDEVR